MKSARDRARELVDKWFKHLITGVIRDPLVEAITKELVEYGADLCALPIPSPISQEEMASALANARMREQLASPHDQGIIDVLIEHIAHLEALVRDMCQEHTLYTDMATRMYKMGQEAMKSKIADLLHENGWNVVAAYVKQLEIE